MWNELADWYVEAAKARIAGGGADGEVARVVLAHAFDRALRLLHPVMPFITEEVWQRLPVAKDADFVARATWPVASPGGPTTAVDAVEEPSGRRTVGGALEFDVVVAAVDAIRSLRSAAGLASGQRVSVIVVPRIARESPVDVASPDTVLRAEAALVSALARADVSFATTSDGAGLRHVCPGFDVVLPLDNIAPDIRAREADKARKEADQLATQLAALSARLGNESFVARAKPEVVEAERQKEREWAEKIARLAEKATALGE